MPPRRLALLISCTLALSCDDKDAEAPKASDPKPEAAPAGEGPATMRVVGHVALPGDQKLDFKAKLERSGAEYTGAIDIPMQGAKDVPLENIAVSTAELSFALANGATWKGTIAADGSIACAFSQGGMNMACTMASVDEESFASAGPKRPQEPKAPFPYATRDMAWDAAHGVHLAGTLTTPEGAGPHPGVIFISGSGQQDRDESIAGHRPFALIADRLARAGVASLRYDDRGAGGSTGDLEAFTLLEEAKDAYSALQQLTAAEGIDAKRIGIIGHSLGGIIGPAVAAEHPDEVAYMVLLAGTGVTGKDMHAEQGAALMRAAKLSDTEIEQAREQNQAIYAAIAPERDEAQMREDLAKIFAKNGMTGPGADAQLKLVTSPWWRHFMVYDPAVALRKSRCAVLIANGELDLQVLPQQNVPAIEAALKAGGNADVAVMRFEGLNHMFQPTSTGAPEEYGTIETTFDEDALTAIVGWVKTKAGV